MRVVRLTTREADGWLPDSAALRAALAADPGIKVVFACSPNNPTGGLLTPAVVEDLIDATRDRAILVIDEAYIDFVPEASVKDRLKGAPQLVIIRTLSKAFALAGLRCGLLIGAPEVIGMIKKVIAPYPVPVPVAAVAEAVLSPEGITAMQRRAEAMKARRLELTEALKRLPGVTAVYEGCGNFILVRFTDARGTYLALRNEGIILREQASQPGLADALRITVGTDDENKRLLSALTKLGGLS